MGEMVTGYLQQVRQSGSRLLCDGFNSCLISLLFGAGLILGSLYAKPLQAQTVADCPVPPPSPVLNGGVICRAFPPFVNPRGLELTDPGDSAQVDISPFPLPRVDFVGGFEFNAASGDGPPFAPTALDKFYIVSEQVANAPPANRPPLAAEIFGPFFYGSLTEPMMHVIDVPTMQSILTVQAQNANNFMVILEIPQAADIFTGGGIETFGGIRFLETIPPQPDFVINELSLNISLPGPLRGPTLIDSTLELAGSPNSSLNGWSLSIVDSLGNVISTFNLDGNGTNSEGYFQFDLSLQDEPGGVLLQQSASDQDALVFITDSQQTVDPNLLTILSDPAQVPLDFTQILSGGSFQVIPDAVKTPFATESFLPYAETLSAMNRYVVINELEVNTADDPLDFDDQYVELYDGNLGAVALDGLVFVSLANDTQDNLTAFNSIDLDGMTAGADGYLVIMANGPVTLPTQSNAIHEAAIYEMDDVVPQGTPEAMISGRELTVESFVSLLFDNEEIALMAENSNGHPTRDSLQRCPDAAQLIQPDPGNALILQALPATENKLNACMQPLESLAETDANQRAAAATEDPVSAQSGEFFTNSVTDINLGGPLPLKFVRRYASLLDDDGRVQSALGSNWMHDYELQLTMPDADTVEIIYFGGRVLQFAADASAPTGWRLVQPLEVAYQLSESLSSFWLMDPLKNLVFNFNNNPLAAFGRLQSIRDRNANIQLLTYPSTSSRLVQSVTDGLGRTLDFTYNLDLLTGITDGTRNLGYAYFNGNLATYTDARGNTTTYQYDTSTSHGALLTNTIRPEANSPLNQIYDTDGTVAMQLDGLSNGIDLLLDVPAAGQSTVSDPTGNQIFTHEPFGRAAIAVQDRAGNSILLNYDVDGRLALLLDRVSGAQRGMTEFNYHPESGKLAMFTDAEDNTWLFSRTAQQQTFGIVPDSATFTFYNLTRIDYPGNTNRQYSYDAAGNLTGITDQAGQQWMFTYNAAGQLLTGTNPTGGVTTNTYNADGTLATVTDSEAGIITYEYDSIRRLNRVLPPQTGELTPPEISFSYNANDQITNITDANGNTVSYGYDNNGNLTSIMDPTLTFSQFGYNLLDNLTTVTDRRGETVTLTYNAERRPQSLSDADGIQSSYGYDVNGNLTSISNAGNTAMLGYNEEGVPQQLTSPLGRTANYESDRLGRLTAVVDPLLNRMEFSYDGLSRLTRITAPSGSRIDYAYDARSQLVAVTVSDDSGNPVAGTNYTRDNTGNLTVINDFNQQDWTFNYSSEGRLSSRSDPLSNQDLFSYDARGRIDQVNYADSDQLTYAYDARSNVVMRSYQSGETLLYSYDELYRLTATDGIDLEYNSEGQVTSIESDGIAFTAAYTPGRRLDLLSYNNGQFTVDYMHDPLTGLLTRVSDDLTNTVVDFFYDADSKLIRIERNNNTETRFSYDMASRLTRVETENTATANVLIDLQLNLDANGRIMSSDQQIPLPPDPMLFADSSDTFSHDAASQVDTTGYVYDGRGRRTAAPGESFVWDGESRVADLNGALFSYNGLGDPVTRSDAAGTLRYHHQAALPGRPLVAEQIDGGAFQRFYIWSPGGTLLYMIDTSASNAVRHFHFDHMGSTLALSDAGGALTDTYLYLPYGQLLAHNGSNDQPFTYHGGLGVLQLDDPGRYYRMGARVYDSQTASFLSREPLWPQTGNPDLLNPYAFALGNPSRFSDAEGLQPRDHNVRISYTGRAPHYTAGDLDFSPSGSGDSNKFGPIGVREDSSDNAMPNAGDSVIQTFIVWPQGQPSIWSGLADNSLWTPPQPRGVFSNKTVVDSFFQDQESGFPDSRVPGDDVSDVEIRAIFSFDAVFPATNPAETPTYLRFADGSANLPSTVDVSITDSQRQPLSYLRPFREIRPFDNDFMRLEGMRFLAGIAEEIVNTVSVATVGDLSDTGRTAVKSYMGLFETCPGTSQQSAGNSNAAAAEGSDNGKSTGLGDGNDPKELDDGDCVL